MKYIELTYWEFGENVLINIDHISHVLERDEDEYREIFLSNGVVIKVAETYWEILNEIQTTRSKQ